MNEGHVRSSFSGETDVHPVRWRPILHVRPVDSPPRSDPSVHCEQSYRLPEDGRVCPGGEGRRGPRRSGEVTTDRWSTATATSTSPRQDPHPYFLSKRPPRGPPADKVEVRDTLGTRKVSEVRGLKNPEDQGTPSLRPRRETPVTQTLRHDSDAS